MLSATARSLLLSHDTGILIVSLTPHKEKIECEYLLQAPRDAWAAVWSRACLERGDRVNVLLRRAAEVGSFAQLGAQPIVGDLLQPETLAGAVANVDAVIHLAAFFRGATEAEARAINQGGTLALAQAARQNGASRFVYISTNLVYGRGRGRPTREDDEPQPRSGSFYPPASWQPSKSWLSSIKIAARIYAFYGWLLFTEKAIRICTRRLT